MDWIFSRKIDAALVLLFGLSFVVTRTSFSVTDVIALLIGAVVFFVVVKENMYSWIISTVVEKILLFFSLLVILSILFLPDDQLMFGLTTLYLISVYFLARFLHLRGYREVLLFGYVLGACVVSVLGLFTILFFENTTPWQIVMQGDRLRLLFSDPNVLGAFLVPALLLVLAKWLTVESFSRSHFILYLGVFSILMSTILLSGSRGAYVQAIVAVTLLLFLERKSLWRQKRKLLTVLFVILGIATSFVLMHIDTSLLASRYSTSILPRIQNLAFVEMLLSERDTRTLLVGSGNGSYEVYSPHGFSAHNMYIRLMVENGVLGLGVFVAFIITLSMRLLRSDSRNYIDHALFAAIVGILIHGMFIDVLHWRHFWLILGLL